MAVRMIGSDKEKFKIKDLSRVTKGVDERIDESVLHWFNHAER